MADVDFTTEVWVPIPGHPGYQVSDQGRVRSVDRIVTYKNGLEVRHQGKLLTPVPSTHGYLTVYVGNRTVRPIHQLVLEAFVSQRPPGAVACHWDDDQTNNSLKNLRWDSRSANTKDMVRNGAHNNNRKSQCKRGHDFTPENTYVTSSGSRQCKTCRLEYQREWHAKRGVRKSA